MFSPVCLRCFLSDSLTDFEMASAIIARTKVATWFSSVLVKKLSIDGVSGSVLRRIRPRFVDILFTNSLLAKSEHFYFYIRTHFISVQLVFAQIHFIFLRFKSISNSFLQSTSIFIFYD